MLAYSTVLFAFLSPDEKAAFTEGMRAWLARFPGLWVQLEAGTGGSWTNVSTGAIKNAGTAVGTNTKSITVTSSTLQGYP